MKYHTSRQSPHHYTDVSPVRYLDICRWPAADNYTTQCTLLQSKWINAERVTVSLRPVTQAAGLRQSWSSKRARSASASHTLSTASTVIALALPHHREERQLILHGTSRLGGVNTGKPVQSDGGLVTLDSTRLDLVIVVSSPCAPRLLSPSSSSSSSSPASSRRPAD